MSRYAQAEVDESIAQVERGVFTPHAQIVLAAEVLVLREQVVELQKLKASNLQAIVEWKSEAERQADSRAALLNEREQLEADNERLRAELAVAEDKWLEYGTRVSDLEAQRDALSAANDSVDDVNEELCTQLAEQEAYTSKIADRCAELSRELTELREAVELFVRFWNRLRKDDVIYDGALNPLRAVLAKLRPSAAEPVP